MKKILLFLVLEVLAAAVVRAESGYELWLRYAAVTDSRLAKSYAAANKRIYFAGTSDTDFAARSELDRAIKSMSGKNARFVATADGATLLVGTADALRGQLPAALGDSVKLLGKEGYLIKSEGKKNYIIANSPVGVLYGVFAYLRQMQTGKSLANLNISDSPALTHRVLNHWDNLNGTIERGYAGYSLWNWEHLPYIKEERYTDYARANASIGVNGVVLNNVNARAEILRREWLVKVAALADVFRPYGIKVYLTAKFSAPKEIGGLATANPTDPQVSQWWADKAKEIYGLIPDFGGFLVKANSEGQPGPQDYGCSHAQGANMLAAALEPYGGVVFWRAFCYQNERRVDRVVTGYNEFKPLDGQFAANVFLQPKNGPIDFQPREPFHPLFGAMPGTALAMELQITQENLGHAAHLVYLGSLFEEVLQSQVDDKGTTVSGVLQGYNHTKGMSGIAAVPNVGTDINWTGHTFGQANWYAYGRLAWNPDAAAADLADEWVRMTFTNEDNPREAIKKLMLISRETYVDYTMPLGLNHIMNFGSHNGPEPWHDDPVWTAFDYHKVSADSIGVDRTSAGTQATDQYHSAIARMFGSLDSCPEEYLLWFHRLPFDYKMKNGKTLWENLVRRYYDGAERVRQMQRIWASVEGSVDRQRFGYVAMLLEQQEREALWWRDGCVLFFQSYSGMPLPDGLETPAHTLDYYKSIPYPYEWNKYYKE